jgi:hypothetical protein
VNAGAPTTGQPFPNTNASLFANAGEVMAETLARVSCATPANCSQVPSADVVFVDQWTDPIAAGRAADASFSRTYAALSTLKPSNAHCAAWDPLCRSTIHYPLNLEPIWKFSRKTFAADGVTVLSDNTCTLCHNPVNDANAVQVPAGQLDLTDSASNVDMTVFTSYRELLFPHTEQTLNMAVLQDLLVPAPGPPDPVTGLPTTIMVSVALAPPMTAGSAGASTAFLKMFDGNFHDPVLDHTGFLTPAELRLISEWLDIGAQYFNDPFVAPAN